MLSASRRAIRQISGIPRDQIYFGADVRDEAHHAARILRRIVHAAEQHIFKRKIFPRAQRIPPAGVEQHVQRILAIDGHERVALLVARSVQRNRQAGADFFLPEPLDAGNDAAGRERDVPRRERDSLGIEQDAHGGHRRVIIEQRLALAHQHDVRLRRELLAIFLERHENLPHDFARREIADQSQLRGEAEMAIDGASGLRRNANRLAAFARHEDGFDLRGLSHFFAGRRSRRDSGSIHPRKETGARCAAA